VSDPAVTHGDQRRCGSYKPGHEPHHIQVRLSRRPGETSPAPVRLGEVQDDGTFTVEVHGEVAELWTHDPARLRALADRAPGSITWQPRWRLLRVGSYCFNVATAADGEPHGCR
jgi:hypothetical protein